jgi:protein-tyrosine phosphatase
MSVLPDPASLIIEPKLPARVDRLANGRFHLTWQPTAERVQVFVGPSAEEIEITSPIAEARGSQSLEVSLAESYARPFFALRFGDVGRSLNEKDNGRILIVAERILPVEGGINLRDLGGYVGLNGRPVRWGRVYRSGMLHHLPPIGWQMLANLGLRWVCDLRSEIEVEQNPTVLPPGTAVSPLSLPVQSPDSRVRQLYSVWRNRNQLDQILFEIYTRVMLDNNAAIIGDILRQLANAGNLPFLYHCTAGKDRTGVVTAVLLCLLGVDDETIIADYSLSNAHYDQYYDTLNQDIQRMSSLGFDVDQRHPLFLAQPQMMADTLAYLRQQYGSIERYVRQQAGLDEQTIVQIRENLLEAPERLQKSARPL